MSIELIINKSLRKNYRSILKLQTSEEVQKFIDTLPKMEKSELFAYSYKYAILEKNKNGEPITEYFLLHIEEFIPDELKDIYDKADKHLNIIFIIAIVIIGLVTTILN